MSDGVVVTDLEMPSEISGGRRWACESCGFASPWWIGCERFPLCTACDAKARQTKRVAMPHSEPERLQVPPGYVAVGSPPRLYETLKAVRFNFPIGPRWVPKSAMQAEGKNLFVKHWFWRQNLAQRRAA
jgi:hypothetical protein